MPSPSRLFFVLLATIIPLSLSTFSHAEWTARRDACSGFLYSNPAVITAANRLRAIAAVPDPCENIGVSVGTIGRQSRWSSFDEPSYLPASIEDIKVHVKRALHGDFDSNPIGDFVQGMIPPSLLQAVQWTARMRHRVPSIREDIGASLVTIFTDAELVRATSDAFAAYASDSVREHCQMRVGGRPAAAQIAACSLAFCLSDRHFCAETVVGMMSDYVESSGNWYEKERKPTSPPLSREFCEEQNEALIDSLSSGGEISDAEAQAYQKTLEECSIHTMAGPWQLADLPRIYQGFYLLHRRFGVIQNGELRGGLLGQRIRVQNGHADNV